MRIIKLLLWLGFFTAIAGAVFIWQWNQYLDAPIQLPTENFTYQVDSGTSLRSLANDLAKEGILDHPRWFVWYATWKRQANKIKAGEYSFAKGTTPRQLLKLLVEGKVIVYKVTFVEGWTVKQMLLELQKHDRIIQSLQGLSPEEVMGELGYPGVHYEGRFFPDTYQYQTGDSDKEILQRAYSKLEQVLAEEWEKRAGNLPYQSAYEALVMASIVEKETGLASERPDIAGVFVRRLQKGMRLQSDPTVIYGLGESFDGNLRRADLRHKSLYNTYVVAGLPPTPIALVGREAIQAALHPAPGESLYFVAKGDGSHYFSATLKEHNQAVKRYQLSNRSKNYTSSPSSTATTNK